MLCHFEFYLAFHLPRVNKSLICALNANICEFTLHQIVNPKFQMLYSLYFILWGDNGLAEGENGDF